MLRVLAGALAVAIVVLAGWRARPAAAICCDAYFEITGTFTNDAPWPGNHINLPPTAHAPPPLAVSAARLAALNSANEVALTRALATQKLHACRGPAPKGSGAPTIAEAIAGYDSVGGVYGGLTIRIGVVAGEKAGAARHELSPKGEDAHGLEAGLLAATSQALGEAGVAAK